MTRLEMDPSWYPLVLEWLVKNNPVVFQEAISGALLEQRRNLITERKEVLMRATGKA